MHEDLNIDPDRWFDTTQDDFMMAFALEDYFKGARSDPRYVQWLARKIVQVEDVWNITFYPLQQCTS